VHTQITPRSLNQTTSNAGSFVSPANMANAGARVGTRQHGEPKGMTFPLQSIVQRQPTTVNALLRGVRCASRFASATRGSL